MAKMKERALFERSASMVAAAIVGGVFLFLFISCTVILSNSSSPPSNTSHSNLASTGEDEWVHRQALQFMSQQEFDKTEQFRQYLRSRGFTDDQIREAINIELSRRGETLPKMPNPADDP
jgi:hypothetical protein